MKATDIFSAIIQGITEFFPVSSDGHLSLYSNLFSTPDLSFIIFLHFASLIAIIMFCWKDLLRLLRFTKEDIRYILLLFIGILPAGIAGYFISNIISSLYTITLTGIFLIINGIIVFSTKYTKEEKNLDTKTAIGIGLMQVFALLPGISRSGMTISTAKFFGLKNNEAFKFSFIMAIPLITGALLFEMKNIQFTTSLIAPFIVCLFVSLFSLYFLRKLINYQKFWIFGIYCIILGIIAILIG